MLRFAFYKAPGTATDKLIRLASRSPYSHVEFVMGDTCISASKRDGGKVREKQISFRPGHWDFLEVLGDHASASTFAAWMAAEAVPYCMLGAITSVTPFHLSRRGRVFCSELMGLICNAGGHDIAEPWRLTPGELHDILKRMSA